MAKEHSYVNDGFNSDVTILTAEGNISNGWNLVNFSGATNAVLTIPATLNAQTNSFKVADIFGQAGTAPIMISVATAAVILNGTAGTTPVTVSGAYAVASAYCYSGNSWLIY